MRTEHLRESTSISGEGSNFNKPAAEETPEQTFVALVVISTDISA